MTKSQKFSLVLARIVLGWMFFYAGITKIMDPAWSAAGYLKGAKTFADFYHWLLTPDILPTVNAINEWGLTLLGISLIFGLFVRLSSLCGVLLMALYYLPILNFPFPNPHAYIVDEHIVYISVMLYFAAVPAGRIWGLDVWCVSLPVCSRFPWVRALFG